MYQKASQGQGRVWLQIVAQIGSSKQVSPRPDRPWRSPEQPPAILTATVKLLAPVRSQMSDLAEELGYEPAPASLLPQRERVSNGDKYEADLEKGDGETKKGWRRLFSWRQKAKA